MKCRECQSNMSSEDYIFGHKYSCENSNCGNIQIEYLNGKQCCTHPNNKVTRFYKDEIEAMNNTDNYLVNNQCQNCGRKNGTSLKKSDYKKFELDSFDYSLLEKVDELKVKYRKEITEIVKCKNEKRTDVFWDDYSEYLKSEQWLEKRKIVLERDKYVCQSCLTKKATQVHHTIGYFRKNEPLFTLFSVCNECHDIITDIERGNHKSAKKITH